MTDLDRFMAAWVVLLALFALLRWAADRIL